MACSYYAANVFVGRGLAPAARVIPREQSDRGNPHLKREIATPVCALARNDRVFWGSQ